MKKCWDHSPENRPTAQEIYYCFYEYYYGKEAGATYVKGTRVNILKDKPIIGSYGVNKRGSNDMYFKGANMLHTLRQIVNNDAKWRKVLRGLSAQFYHQTNLHQNFVFFVQFFLFKYALVE